MMSARENDKKKDDTSGLALALLFDRCFIDLFDIFENNNPPRRFRAVEPLEKCNTRAANKNVCLRRYL